MSDPIVSVIIPCYNHGAYIDEAIKSVEKCASVAYEIIIVNDGSTDNYTNNRLRELKSNSYKVITQENKGVSAARNNAISSTRGKYILPLDADNKITPGFIPKALRILEANPNVAIVYTDKYIIKENKTYIKKAGRFDLSRLLLGNYIDTCAVFKKVVWETVGGYDENVDALEDYELWLSASRHGFCFYYLPEPHFYYRVLENSLIRRINANKLANNKLTYIYQKNHELVIPEFMKHRKELKRHLNDQKHPFKASLRYFIKGCKKLIKKTPLKDSR